jgi:hypothetical protein
MKRIIITDANHELNGSVNNDNHREKGSNSCRAHSIWSLTITVNNDNQ